MRCNHRNDVFPTINDYCNSHGKRSSSTILRPGLLYLQLHTYISTYPPYPLLPTYLPTKPGTAYLPTFHTYLPYLALPTLSRTTYLPNLSLPLSLPCKHFSALAVQRYIYVCHPAVAKVWCTLSRYAPAPGPSPAPTPAPTPGPEY